MSSDSDSDYVDLSEIRGYRDVVKYIKREEPRVEDILSMDASLPVRCELFQMWEIYKELDPNTDEWLRVRKLLVSRLRGGDDYYKRADKLKTCARNRERILRRVAAMAAMDDGDRGKMKEWLDVALSLPWDIRAVTPRGEDVLRRCAAAMDKEFYGMQRVKENVLVMINQRLNGCQDGYRVGLVGPPGCGKTAISRVIAEVVGLPWEQISLGSMRDAEFIKGHDYAWIGSGPGEVVKCLSRMGCANGIILVDEYEKADAKMNGALLHMTDAEHNKEWRDLYLDDLAIDLSSLWWFFSMNELPTCGALSDRLKVLEVPGYTRAERLVILKQFIYPKLLRKIGVTATLAAKAAEYLVDVDGDDVCGVRRLKDRTRELLEKVKFTRDNPTIATSWSAATKKNISLDLVRQLF